MKVAFWGLGIIVLGMLGILLINLFGNITVTNQFNYTAMKNTVEAAMNDAKDIAHYRSGFCLCPKKKDQNSFNNKNDYEIKDITNNTCDNGCKALYGEYKIDSKVFTESLIRRFSELVNNNKDYQIIIQDIVEYPPKVSVKVDSNDEFAFNEGEFTITNQIDALLEEKEES